MKFTLLLCDVFLGKTTLLNLIANRISQSSLSTSKRQQDSVLCQYFSLRDLEYSGSGEILFNGRKPSSTEIRQSIGYGKLCRFRYVFVYWLLMDMIL